MNRNGAVYLLVCENDGQAERNICGERSCAFSSPKPVQSPDSILAATPLHVSLATAGRWREKEERSNERERAKATEASFQAPSSGDPRGEEAGGGGAKRVKPAAMMFFCLEIVLQS